MCQEKEKEDLPALRTGFTYQYNDLKTTYKKCGGRLITTTKTILRTWGPTERQQPENIGRKTTQSTF